MSKLFDLLNSIITKVNKAVRYSDEQNLTEEQKAQARNNIGAISEDGVPKQVQTDWNQSSRKYPDYVKNRTHYTMVAYDSGYRADLMDSTHNIGDIVLLRNIPISILDRLFIPGINASYRSEYSFHLVYKVTFYEGTDVYEYENDKECIANEEMEISEFSTSNIKVLYHNKREPSIALYIIYDLTTLHDEDKTKFAKTGIYAQLVSLNAADTATSILVGYRSIRYKKLHSKYIDIPVATNDVAGVVKPVTKTNEMSQPVGVDENGVLFTVPPGGSGDMQKSVYDPNNKAKDMFKYADDASKLAVTNHALSDTAHSDIRDLITGLTDRLNALADSDDTTLDQLSEIVAYIKSNKSLIDAITTNKVSVSDIVDNLTSSATNKPLSAAQGKALKTLIDAITIPEKLPNPNALTFTGAMTGSYDGSSAVTVHVPSGGGSGGTVGYPVVSMTASTEELTPNTYYRWGEISALTVTLAEPTNTSITNEYCFEFVSGVTATTLSVPDTVKWVKEPNVEAGKTYQVSILNGIGVICGA